MAKHIFKGQGAPSFAPKQVGHHYIDTLNKLSYISTGTATSADWKLFNDSVVSVNGYSGTVVLAASDIGSSPTGDVVATNVQAAIAELASEKQATSEKGQANGYAGLDGTGKVPAAQLPSYVDDVVEYANLVSFPGTGETGKIYVALDTNKTYRWTGSVYVEISPSEVNSVFGRVGIVVAQSGDYNAGQITNAPAGNIASTNVQAALNELDTEKVPTTRTITAGTGLSGGGDLSANRTISMPNVGTAGTYGSAIQIPVITTDAQGRVSAITPTALNLQDGEASATASTSTTSGTDVLMDSMTLTPSAGTYLVWFSTSLQSNNNNSVVFVSIYAGGSQVAHTQRQARPRVNAAAGLGGSANVDIDTGIATNGKVTVNGSQAIEIRWRRTAGTATALQRTLNILKLS